MVNYYRTLGVKDFSSMEEVKAAYRKLSKKFHPDVNDNDPFFEDRFKEIQTAYEVLSDSRQKALHDANLKSFIAHHHQPKPAQQSYPSHQYRHIYQKKQRLSDLPQIRLSKKAKWLIYLCCLVLAVVFYLLLQEEKAEQENLAKQWQYFSLGSTRFTVTKVQGEPTRTSIHDNFEVWHYGASSLVFKDDTLVEIYNRAGNLKLLPSNMKQ